MSFDFSTLITNRSSADLENLRALLSTPMEDWTAEQLAQFNQAISKGAYNYTDLNRVTACMEYLDETLRSYGYETGYQRIIIPHTPLSPSTYDENTLLLLHGESLEDSSIYDVPITNNGVAVSDVQSKFGGSSYYFNGTTSYIQTRNLLQGAGPFTIDFWLYPIQIKNNTLWSHGGTNAPAVTGGGIEFYNNSTFIYYCDGFLIRTTQTFAINQWYHIAFVGDGASIKLYVNGILNGTYSGGYNFGNYPETFGANDSTLTGETLIGYMDEIRVSNVARWTSDFTPPTEPYEVVILPEDPRSPYTWYESDTPTAPQMAQYLSNVLSIWSTIMGDPTLPETMVNLTQEGANQIEAALIEVNTAIEQIIAAMARSNSFTFWSGNRPFPTAYSNRGRNWAELDAMGTSWRNWQVANWYLLLYGNLEAEGDVT